MKRSAQFVSAIAAVSLMALPASAQFNLGDILPKTAPTQGDSNGKKTVAGIAACAGTAGILYTGVKIFKDKLIKDGNTAKEVEQIALLAGAVGCIVGGKAAVSMIENMDDQSKKAQEEAWAQAQTQADGQPVAWKGPEAQGYKGAVSMEDPETMPDGTECANRKNYVESGGVTGTEYIRVCKNASGLYAPVEA